MVWKSSRVLELQSMLTHGIRDYMIQVFKELIPKEVCNLLIEEGLTRPQLNAGIGEDNLISEGRSTKISFIGHEGLKDYIHELVVTKYENYDITEAEDIQFATYNVGDFYGWHADSDDINKRVISVTVQLSDPKDYKGGNLVFKVDAMERAQGTVVVFPSNIRHQVTRVTAGTRYSLVQWFKGNERN